MRHWLLQMGFVILPLDGQLKVSEIPRGARLDRCFVHENIAQRSIFCRPTVVIWGVSSLVRMADLVSLLSLVPSLEGPQCRNK